MVATTIAPCTGTTAEAQTGCAMTFVQAFAEQAYRRPITADELADLMTVTRTAPPPATTPASSW